MKMTVKPGGRRHKLLFFSISEKHCGYEFVH